MYYSYFTFHIQIKSKKKKKKKKKKNQQKRGWVRGYGEERAERTTAASSWFWGLKYTGIKQNEKKCGDLKKKKKKKPTNNSLMKS